LGARKSEIVEVEVEWYHYHASYTPRSDRGQKKKKKKKKNLLIKQYKIMATPVAASTGWNIQDEWCSCETSVNAWRDGRSSGRQSLESRCDVTEQQQQRQTGLVWSQCVRLVNRQCQ